MAHFNVNTLLFKKINALKRLGLHLGLWGKYTSNPYSTGDLPYEKQTIFTLFYLLHCENIPKVQFTAICLLLDWYFPDWKKFISKEVFGKTIDRDSPEVRKWKSLIFRKYGNKCVECGSATNLHAHHICGWAEYPELRIEVDNGELLCGNCHHDKHPKMGIGLFTKNFI